ncbi:hypothetical protein [Caviibacterium pharyngocola]|uniref:Rough colony protein B n=1 Tax=Caviibacterium pharyngocola TaxID=28159 RepID=A0A2M8RWU5_9PAST|nr:hypothetical protein [Caviibacterium pharyngocola]PJG83357.1 hypothetical protein CVP04_04330 [Caviibacterium pharyngocola]
MMLLCKKTLCYTLLLLGSLSASADYALDPDNVAQPQRAKQTRYELMKDLFVLEDYSDTAMANLVRSVSANVGRDLDKKVVIFWNGRLSKERAVYLRKELLRRHIQADNVLLQKDSVVRPLYPLSVEVQRISADKINCPLEIGENVAPAQYDYCASKSNSRIHLKN